eukprot:GEMP01053359.1.p1 GENE.GEMP01053359.1~~GEMP01053359.1.p1  ORF type:complete len:214 (+),score=55.03 GEMP01053359.1:65-706(+)
MWRSSSQPQLRRPASSYGSYRRPVSGIRGFAADTTDNQQKRPCSAIDRGHLRRVPTPPLHATRLGSKFKSNALEMEVQLTERLCDLRRRAFPRKAKEHDLLLVYSAAFHGVIQSDKAFAGVLGMIKDGYHSLMDPRRETMLDRRIVKSPQPPMDIPALDMSQVQRYCSSDEEEALEEEYEEEALEEELEEEYNVSHTYAHLQWPASAVQSPKS